MENMPAFSITALALNEKRPKTNNINKKAVFN